MTRNRKLALSSIAVAAVAALLWAFMPTAIRVETAKVTRGPFVQTLDEDGVTRVRHRYLITAPVSGTLLRPRVEAGDTVTRDEIVATIIPSAPELLDPRTRAELIARREAAEARLSRARTLVRQAEAASRQAALDVERLEELGKQGYSSKAQREQAALSVDLRARDLEAARFEADAAFHDAQQSRAAVSRLAETGRTPSAKTGTWEMNSPVSGRVLDVLQESGGPVTVGTVVLEVGDVSQLEAVIDVLSSEAPAIVPGAAVELLVSDDVRLAGRVRRVEPSARTKISALGVEEQRVNVIVDLLESPPPACVGDGYRVDARIEVARAAEALQVPSAALIREGSSWAVFVVRNERARLQRVEIGLRNAEHAVVMGGGLDTGDEVIVYPGDTLGEGSRIVR